MLNNKLFQRRATCKTTIFQKGFTLIEIMIALTIFAILASITSSVLFYSLQARKNLIKVADSFSNLELAFIILEKSFTQMTNRAIRSDNMREHEAFKGSTTSVSFTRGGINNPLSLEKRSSLQRIEFLCKDNQLIQRTWLVLDPINMSDYQDKTLLPSLKNCQFAYLNKNLTVLNEWQAQALPQAKRGETPKAVRISLTFENNKTLNYLFILPQGLYDAKI